MIFSYGESIVGSSHIKKGTVCQDFCGILRLDNGWVIAAVADGVGSSKYSDVASRLAVETSIEICAEEIRLQNIDDVGITTTIIKKAFAEAEMAIDKYSLGQNHPVSDYDTTLSLVVYNGTRIAFGHCGDGGIVGLTEAGDYVKITSPQKKDGMYVIPLRDGHETWVISHSDECLATVLLATDGVYDTFFPYLLKGQEVEVYVPLIRYFMDNNLLNVSDENMEAVSRSRIDFLSSETCASITDDKTLVALINENIKPTVKPDEFYAEPNWDVLQQKWNEKAYPHLYNEKKDDA